MSNAVVILAITLGGILIVASFVEFVRIRRRNMANSLAAVVEKMQDE